MYVKIGLKLCSLILIESSCQPDSCWALLKMMYWQRAGCSCVGLGGMKLTFFIAAHMLPCFVFVAKTVSIPYKCFGCCWAGLAQRQGFLSCTLLQKPGVWEGGCSWWWRLSSQATYKHVEALLPRTGLDLCLLMGSGEWIPLFALLVHAAFTFLPKLALYWSMSLFAFL